jgi:hypothetical protein
MSPAADSVNPGINPDEDPWGIPPTSISWDVEPPFTVGPGLIVKQEIAQQTDFDSKKPFFWEDGRARKKVIITLQCQPDDTEAEDDDGMRSIHAKIPSGIFVAIRDAVKEAGKKTLPVDGEHYLTVTYTGNAAQTAAEKKQKRSPTKEFVALITDSSEPPF